MFKIKKLWRVSLLSLIIMPLALLGIDTDLEQMNKYDDEQMKALSPLFTTRAGYAYSDWKMPSMASFTQETQGLNLAWIDVIYKGNRDTVDGNRNYLHYERSFNKNWNEKIIPQQDSIKNLDNYELLVAKITANIKEHPIFLKGSTERFLSHITSQGKNIFVDKHNNMNNLEDGDSLVFETKFNELMLGTNPLPFIDAFIFFNDYQKPYTIRRHSQEINKFKNYLFYSKIKSYGFGFNADLYDYSNNISTPIFGLGMKLGLADIELTDNMDLDDFQFDTSYYAQFDIKLGYSWIPFKSLKNFSINMQGIYEIRYFDEKTKSDNTIHIGENSTNRDEIKKAFVSLQYSF